ncbi:PstS family phosphate ABC transporter substrate-binding protein [Halococcoides cellulosivorans]|uniref:Phosphate ABC transporter substrate-binding protein n=1 Tax=Halococcoides cellulosivorans TaxID=1679096 RepID=A0A2R4WZC9_9EURY|nr:PstS family phosphate ABC transporter substrate-binding protein [Halococcoides cellulosivorans]AWB26899.1 phosphate ABC transporter substrate-binding protein [Halococcoides cellulosivorans]
MAREIACSVSRRELLLGLGAGGLGALGGCVRNVRSDRSDPTGQVVVKGSSTVYLISDLMAERFMEEHPVNVTVDSTGTGGGFKNHFCPGTSDINGASRPITDAERSNCADNDIDPVEFQVGRDALTVAVNNDADWVDCLTYEELSKIWREGGAERWSDVRSEWPEEPIKLFGPAPTSGTYDWFDNHVVGEDLNHTPNHEQTEKDNIIIQGIEDDPHAMGYFGYAYYTENSDRVKAVPVDGGDGCGAPTLDNAVEGTYPMTRPLFIYVDRDALARDAVFEFVAFYLERAATDWVSEVGYVPVSESIRDENLSKLLRERP